LGTGGCWFLFDVAFYANVVYAPTILEMVFGLSSTAGTTAMAGPTALIFLIALPGYYLAVLFVDRLGLKRLQMIGFILIGFLYLILGFTTSSTSAPPPLLFALYAGTFTLFNMGPNATTFCLPAKTFPFEARSTFNGMSAALGKLGAVVGTAVFPYIINQSGSSAGLFFTCGICFFGAIVTRFLVENDFNSSLDGVESGSSVLLDANASQTLMEMAPIVAAAGSGSGAYRKVNNKKDELHDDEEVGNSHNKSLSKVMDSTQQQQPPPPPLTTTTSATVTSNGSGGDVVTTDFHDIDDQPVTQLTHTTIVEGNHLRMNEANPFLEHAVLSNNNSNKKDEYDMDRI
jgi:hypothetical protein